MLRQQRHGSWNGSSQDEVKVGRHTVRLKRSLGEGGFAFIHLVEDVNTGRVLVLKRSSLQSHEGRVVYEKEASVMRGLAHPNIVQIVTAVELQSSKTGAILMEYCPRGHLLEALNSLGGKRMPEAAVLSVMCDVVCAVKYLHDKGITHRDIKLENILRSSSGPHKLCDFGSCVQGRVPLETAEQRANEEEVVEKTTTQMYRAPEMVDLYLERELTEKVDVWAMGCVLYAVCYLKNPFQDAGNLGILNARIRIPDDSEYSSGLVDLIRRCLTASSVYRPSASEIEGGIHALAKGNPLPPPRHGKSSEPERGYADGAARNAGGVQPAPAAASTPSGAGSSPSIDGGPAREAGRGGGGARGSDGGSRRSGSGLGAGGSACAQGATPPKPAPAAPQPQLNPNSVAARRLASRKGSHQAGVSATAGAAVLPPPSSEQAPAGAAAPAGSRPTTSAVAGAGGGGDGTVGDPDPDGWSNFAAFDQFLAPDLPASGRDGSFGASFEAPATATASSSAAAGVREAESRVAGVGGSPLLDLPRHGGEAGRLDRNGGGSCGGVAALGDQLAGVSFPSASRTDQQAWLAGSSAGQVLGGRTMSGPGGNGFAATFPRLGSGGIVVASGSSQQQQQQQQQQYQERQHSSPSLSPPPPQAAVVGGMTGSPPPAGQPHLLGQTQVSQPRWHSPQKQQQQHQNHEQRQPQQQQQQQLQWQPGDQVNAGWNGGSATWSAGMGEGVALRGSPPAAASPPLPVFQGHPSSTSRSLSGSWAPGNNGTGGVAVVANGGGVQVSGSPILQQQQQPQQRDMRLLSGSPPQTQFPGGGGSW